MGVLVAEAPKSYALVSTRASARASAKEDGGVMVRRGHYNEHGVEDDEEDDEAYATAGHAVNGGPAAHGHVPDPHNALHALDAHTVVDLAAARPGSGHCDVQDKNPAGIDWAPRPKKKWIRHFLANEETPPSHDEFPSSFCRPVPLPVVLNGRLPAAPVPVSPPLPTPIVPSLPAVLPILTISPAVIPVVAQPVVPVVPFLPASPPPPQLPVSVVQTAQALQALQALQGPQVVQAPSIVAHPVIRHTPSPVPVTPPPHQFSPQPDAPAASTTPLQAVDSPGNASQDDDLLGQESRRRTGSGTREVHNKLEKNRRAHLKECFEMLKRQLPTCQEEKKCSNLSILHAAIRYIQSLRRKERDYEHEMERLAREKISAQQRLACLKKDLAQWDHIDVNALYPDCVDSPSPNARVRMPSPASTSTASAELEGGMIIDEDEEDDDDDETMSFHSGRQRSASDSSSAMPTYCSPQPHPVNGANGVNGGPSLRDLHGYRGESPQVPVQSRSGRSTSPVSPRPHTTSPVVSRIQSGPGVNGHIVDATTGYRIASTDGRGVSAPSSGYVPAKLLNYSIKVASPATTSSVSPPAPSPVGVLTRVPSSPVGTLTTLPGAHTPHAPARSRSPPPASHASHASHGALLQAVALPLTSHHIQLPVPAQVMNNGHWLGVSPTILQLTTPSNQRLVLEPAALPQHSATSNGSGMHPTSLVTHQRLRDLGVASQSPPHGSPHGSPIAVSAATAAISVPSMAMHPTKVMVGATGITPVSAVTIVGHGNPFHKSSSADGIRPTKGLHLASDTNGHLLTTAVRPGVVSTHPMSQGCPVTHILAANPIGKVAPLIKTMVNPQYLGAVVKPTMVVVSSASTLPPNSGA